MAEQVERWRPIIGFEALYEVSDFGRVRRVGRANRVGKGRGGGAVLGRILRDQHTNGGYRTIQLWRNGQPSMHLVHRLVCEAFHGAEPSLEVNHRNGDKHDNRLVNLEWVTHSENNAHAYALGLRVGTNRQRTARQKTHCPRGHELTSENLRLKGNRRICRVCHRASVRARKQKQRGIAHGEAA